LLVARIATVEVASAFGRKGRDGAFSAQRVARLWRQFKGHWQQQYQPMPLTDDVFVRAERLVLAHPIRAYDAVHLACALDIAARFPAIGLEFWTADRRQAQVAAAEGLAVRLVG
jgi:uncharacterized protein